MNRQEISTWRVLVVDDEPDNLHLVADLLEFSGAYVIRSDSGRQALELFDQQKPTIILLDLAMPDIDGWEVHRQLRARSGNGRLPIIALTALAMPSDAEKVRAEGFDGYITKPFRVHNLLEEVAACAKKCAEQTASPALAPAAPEEQTNDRSQ
jgi:CheY-like chemotaxis protein